MSGWIQAAMQQNTIDPRLLEAEFSLKCLLIELESIEYWNLRQHFQTQAQL